MFPQRFHEEVGRLFQAFVAPAIFFSASALLILSINTRLMGIVSRLRHFVHAKHDAARSGRSEEADAYNTQIASIEHRAELVRRSFVCTLIALGGILLSCLLLGCGLYWTTAAVGAAVVFVSSMLVLLVGVVYYVREVTVALSSVRDEARDLNFMNVDASEGFSPRAGFRTGDFTGEDAEWRGMR